MNASDPSQGPARVAYQGAPGAFSHAACLALRPWDEPVAFETFDQAINAVRSGECGLALIPVENSTIGVVQPAADLVAASGLEVVTEVWRPIRLALMAAPGARLSDLKTAESHPAALGQCVKALADLGLEAREVFDPPARRGMWPKRRIAAAQPWRRRPPLKSTDCRFCATICRIRRITARALCC